jgi:hypothetical protein
VAAAEKTDNLRRLTMHNSVNKEEWIAMFREVGLSDVSMKKWHHLFETRHPEGHKGFLNWLGIPSDEIKMIRENSR